MRATRRVFLGFLLIIAGGAAGGVWLKNSGKRERLLTDPEARDFIYRNGWIERV